MKKRKIFLTAFLILALLAPSFIIKAQVDQDTIDYLTNAEQNSWVTQALKAAGQSDFDLNYLNDFTIANATDAAKAVLAVIAAGSNPYSYQNQNYVGSLMSYYQDSQIGSLNLVNDDFWGILALVASGERTDAAVIRDAKNFILTAQNGDGGWGWAPQSESDTNDTAAAIMALLSAGEVGNFQAIQTALDYLRSAQNEDGGFPFSTGESDSGSDAWVIAALNKLNINPRSWQQNGHDPLSHLLSLKLNDGSFKWLAADNQGNLIMTAYAAVALSGHFYPVAVYQPAQDQDLHHLRIEGSQDNICNAQVEGQTVQEILENGALICDYTYHIQNTDWGPYLNRIGNDQAEGQIGWLYRVNWLAAEVGMAEYILQPRDEVLFYYSYWEDQPLRLALNENQANPGDNLAATVQFFDGQNWIAADNVNVIVGEHEYQTDNSGQANFVAPEEGSYLIYAQAEHFIRSAREVLIVGEGSSNSVGLNVDVFNDQPEEDEDDDNGVVFQVSANSLDFGSLRPGASLSRSLTITNDSAGEVYLEGIVSGDILFEDNLSLNNQLWENYNTVLPAEQSTEVNVNLVVPQNYQSGHYSASLVLWGTAR